MVGFRGYSMYKTEVKKGKVDCQWTKSKWSEMRDNVSQMSKMRSKSRLSQTKLKSCEGSPGTRTTNQLFTDFNST